MKPRGAVHQMQIAQHDDHLRAPFSRCSRMRG
jgi:hypothetical protein